MGAGFAGCIVNRTGGDAYTYACVQRTGLLAGVERRPTCGRRHAPDTAERAAPPQMDMTREPPPRRSGTVARPSIRY
jgi:hypothetical protein